MSFILNCLRVDKDVINNSLVFPGDAGLQLEFSKFEGYSPVLDGSIRTSVADYSDSSEKSSDIIVTISVRASYPSYESNIRISHVNNALNISTGGLSLGSYITFPRLTIDVAISLPSTIGPLSLHSPNLPIHVHSISKAGDVVLKSGSAHISVSDVEARSLTVSSSSGSIKFEDGSKQIVDAAVSVTNSSGSITLESSSEQVVDTAINVTNSSGGTRVLSKLTGPEVKVQTNSGSLQLGVVTTARQIAIHNSSGGISGEVSYKKEGSTSRFENSSGRIDVKLRDWSGFLTTKTSSGGCHVTGLQRWNDGWRKGDGNSKATFITNSGGIHIEAL